MSAVEFGTLQDVPVRQGWPHEAAGFTPWLSENLVRLGGALGVRLSPTRVENTGDGVGVFVRGGRGVSMEAVTERLAPYEAELEARLGVGLTNTSFPLLVRRDFDMADQQTWPSAIAWLHETTEAYVQALSEILPAAPAATPD